MSVFLKPNVFKARDDNDEFRTLSVIAEASVQDYLEAIEEKGEDTIESIPDDYTALSSEVDDLKADLSDISAAVGYKTKIMEGAYLSSSGVVSASAPAVPWNLLCINLNPKDIIASIKLSSVSQSIVYGFFTSEPSMGSTTYNNQRIATGALSVANLDVPANCSWLAIRYNPSDYPDVLFSNIVDVNKGVLVQGEYVGDLNNIHNNSIYYAPSSASNLPSGTSGAFIVQTNKAVSGTYIQTAIGWSEAWRGARFVRIYINGAWTDWVSFDNIYQSKPFYIATGDSLMYGAKWLATETDPYYEIVRTSIENRMPTRIANAIGANSNFANVAVGGAYYVGTGSNTILSQLQSIDLTDARLITISGGRNDSGNPLGDKMSMAGDGTICGAIKEIINYIYTQNKKTQIVVVQVTPNTTDNSTVFTKTYSGGWSLNSYAEKVGEMCAELNIGFVTWNGCTYLNHWIDYTGAGNNYAHPNNDEAYLQMGNFIGGKIAALYRG